jgi:Tol biopolymer transport system component
VHRRQLPLFLLAALVGLPGATAAIAHAAPSSPRLAVSVRGRIVIVDPAGRHRLALTDAEDGRAVKPAWSPDGRRIAYVRLTRHAAALFVVDADGGTPRRLTHHFGTTEGEAPWLGQPVWSPDGRRIAFAAGHGFYVVTTSGRLRRVAPPRDAGDGRPQWLANGLLALCRGYSDGGVLLDPSSGRTSDVAARNCGERGPFWSPDGARYLLARGDTRANAQLVVLGRRGQRAQLTNDLPRDPEVHFDDCCARWSQDGSRIVFLSDRLGQLRRDAFVVRNDGSGERRLTFTGDIGDAALSADDSTLAVLRNRTLWTIPLRGGEALRVADHVNWGWAWEPQGRPPVRQPPVGTVRPPPRRIAIKQRYYPFRSHRLVDVRRFAPAAPGELGSVSRDGSFVTYTVWSPHDAYSVGVIDLREARIRRLASGASPFYPSAPLSPEGDAILLRRWSRLYRVDVATGRTTFLASGAAGDSAGWLSHGRVRFVDRRGRLVDATAGGRIRPTGIVLSRKLGSYVSWSPGGRYVLYAHDCATWLRDLRTGNERRVAGPVIPGAWSPDGVRFLLTSAEWGDHCTGAWTALWGGFSIRDVRGRAILGYGNGYPAWSADGRFVTVNGGVSGTAVTYLQPLAIFRLRTRTLVPLLRNRLDGTALAGPGGWLLYSRFPAAADPNGPPVRSAMFLARLAPRWR